MFMKIKLFILYQTKTRGDKGCESVNKYTFYILVYCRKVYPGFSLADLPYNDARNAMDKQTSLEETFYDIKLAWISMHAF